MCESAGEAQRARQSEELKSHASCLLARKSVRSSGKWGAGFGMFVAGAKLPVK